MSNSRHKTLTTVALAAGMTIGGLTTVAAAETPVRGGMLNYVVASDPPSFDGHRETTFGVVHPVAPFYSGLIRLNPENAQSPTDIICDLCEGKWQLSADGMVYTFKIKQNVVFHDGTPLTAADIKATLDKIVFPPEGVPSSRKAWYSQIAAVETPEKYTLVVKMKRPLAAIIPALASPFNFVYAKKDLDTHGYNWHTKNVNGTGPYKFVQFQSGAFVEGKRNDTYHVKGLPYLDGFKAVIAPKMSVRLQAIRGNRAAIEFRSFPPKAVDDLVKALGKKVVVQESNWNVIMGAVPNQRKKELSDPRVRRALGHALDRYNGAKYLGQIAIIKYVGGIVFPGHPLEAKKDMLEKMPGFGRDAAAEREKAKQLLKEAGVPNLKVSLWNRAVDQPYKPIGTWFVDQWRKVGIVADQKVVPSGPWYAGLRQTRDFDVAIDFNAQTIVNPTTDVSKWTCEDGKTPNNYSNCKDKRADELYYAMLYETDAQKQYDKMRAYEKHVIAESAQWIPAFWWYRMTAQRSYVKNWHISPSHYLNQQLDQVWIDKKLM